MSWALALTLVAAAADPVAAEPAPYPVKAVLAAFATACSGAENRAVNVASVEAAGWERFAPTGDDPIAKLIAFGKKAVADMDAREPGGDVTEMLDGGVYRKTVAGRDLTAIISGVRMGTLTSNGCRVYDLGEAVTLDKPDLEGWAVRAPNDWLPDVGGVTKATWNPGLKPGHMEMEILFGRLGQHMGQLDPALASLQFDGIVLTATYMEIDGQ